MGTFDFLLAIFALICLVQLVYGLWHMAKEWGVGYNAKTAAWCLEKAHLVVYWIMAVVGGVLWLFAQEVEVTYWGSPVGYDFGAPMPYYHVVPNFWYSTGVWCLYLLLPATFLTFLACQVIKWRLGLRQVETAC